MSKVTYSYKDGTFVMSNTTLKELMRRAALSKEACQAEDDDEAERVRNHDRLFRRS